MVVVLGQITSPSSWLNSPVIILKSVDLPAPFTPTMATLSFSSILNDTFLSITSVPNDLLMLFRAKIIIFPPYGIYIILYLL